MEYFSFHCFQLQTWPLLDVLIWYEVEEQYRWLLGAVERFLAKIRASPKFKPGSESRCLESWKNLILCGYVNSPQSRHDINTIAKKFEKFSVFQVSRRIYEIANQQRHWFLIKHLSFAEMSVYKVRFEKCERSWRKLLVWKPWSRNHISNKNKYKRWVIATKTWNPSESLCEGRGHAEKDAGGP